MGEREFRVGRGRIIDWRERERGEEREGKRRKKERS